jgi:ABC-type nitrate/sulfonate/bicarbonate transport system permease component
MPLGVLMGRSKLFDAIVHPWVNMGVVTSVAAVVPLVILMFGTGFMLRVSVVFLASVWYVVLTTYHGARGLEPRWIDVARAFGATAGQRFFKILLPGLFPYLMTAARLGLLHAIRAMVVAEMFVIVGYGGLIHNAGIATSTAPLLGLLFTLMVVGIVASWLLRRAGARIAPWYEDRAAAR